MEAAEGLYNQLEEEVHDLVSQSNSCLERLEFLRKVRELEAEFGKVSGAAPGAGRSQSPPRHSTLELSSRGNATETFSRFLSLMMKEVQIITGLPEL